MKNITTFLWFLLGGAVLAFSRPAFGQGNLGAVTGTVQDPSGAVVPDAEIVRGESVGVCLLPEPAN